MPPASPALPLKRTWPTPICNSLKRGDFVTIAMQGDFGKPRPALMIQADQLGLIGAAVKNGI
jgi:hypothetical protein